MSTNLGVIKAKIEVPVHTESSYIDIDVRITGFWGGTQRGHSVQFAFTNENNETCHFQLDAKAILQLKTLLDNF